MYGGISWLRVRADDDVLKLARYYDDSSCVCMSTDYRRTTLSTTYVYLKLIKQILQVRSC
jgi:hypothetical protein